MRNYCRWIVCAIIALACGPSLARAAFTEGALTNSNQAITTDATYTDVLAAVNFRYSTQGVLAAPSVINGLTYQNYDWLGGTQVLATGASLGVAHSGGDNTGRQRFQNTAGTITGTGPDEAVLESLANTINFYAVNENGTFTLSGLQSHKAVKVQFFGGDDGASFGNWSGDLVMRANGVNVGTWNAGDDGNNTSAKFATFDAVTTADGRLVLNAAQIIGGQHAGIAGLAVVGSQATPAFIQENLTNTAQILAPDAQFDHVEAAVNLRFLSQAGASPPGTVNGIQFQDIDWLGGVQALTDGGTISIASSFAPGDRSRFQTTAGTITGTDEGVLESIVNTINFQGTGESVTFNLTGLPEDREMRIQVLGGDAGASLGNWLGDFAVTANGDPLGTWDIVADDNASTASLLTMLANTDGAGNLQLTFSQTNAPPGQFAGIAGFVITSSAAAAVPEPTTWVAMLLTIPVLVVSRRWWRRG